MSCAGALFAQTESAMLKAASRQASHRRGVAARMDEGRCASVSGADSAINSRCAVLRAIRRSTKLICVALMRFFYGYRTATNRRHMDTAQHGHDPELRGAQN